MKKVRTTSRLAYLALVKSGALRGKQAKIMHELTDGSPPATSGEILYQLGVRNTNAWRARFCELHARGLIREAGIKVCTVSKRRCITWEPTGTREPLRAGAERGVNGAGRSDARNWRNLARGLLAIAEVGPIGPEIFYEEATKRGLIFGAP